MNHLYTSVDCSCSQPTAVSQLLHTSFADVCKLMDSNAKEVCGLYELNTHI